MKQVLKYLKKIQEIPNAPFMQDAMIRYLTEELEKHKIPYIITPYALIVNSIKHDSTEPKLLCMAHTDHPGIVLQNNTQGMFFGTPYAARLQNLLKDSPIPISVYPRNSTDAVIKGSMVEISAKGAVSIELTASNTSVTNAIAQYTIHNQIQEDDATISVYNADNGVAVATLLDLIMNTFDTATNVTYCFTLHEEVHQISSWELARTNYFGLSANDFILNLECLTVNNISEYTTANYTDGVVLQLSNTGCLFGYRFQTRNILEDVIRDISDNKGIPIQTGLIQDSCDSRPFSYFAITPNICTLTVPNKHKHNKGDQGEVVLETVLKRDIENLSKLSHEVIESFNKTVAQKGENISEIYRSNDSITDHDLMKKKAILNERLRIAYLPAVKRGYYYPESLQDNLSDLFYKGISYVKYIYLLLFYRKNTRKEIAAKEHKT